MTVIGEKKAAEMYSQQVENGKKLLDFLAADSVNFTPTFLELLSNASDFLEVAANLDSHKEWQTEMYSLFGQVKELGELHFGDAVLQELSQVLDQFLHDESDEHGKLLKLHFQDTAQAVLDRCQMQGRVDFL